MAGWTFDVRSAVGGILGNTDPESSAGILPWPAGRRAAAIVRRPFHRSLAGLLDRWQRLWLPSTAWYALPSSDEWGMVAPRLPVQLLGAILTLGLFAGLEQARGWLRRPGLAASLGLLGWATDIFWPVIPARRSCSDLARATPGGMGSVGGGRGWAGAHGFTDSDAQPAIGFSAGVRSDGNEMIDLTIDTTVVRRIIIEFIRKQLSQAGYTRGVINLSGGIDSALACTLAAEALGPQNVLAIRLPYRTSSRRLARPCPTGDRHAGCAIHHPANHAHGHAAVQALPRDEPGAARKRDGPRRA